jgi:hypothetical protein
MKLCSLNKIGDLGEALIEIEIGEYSVKLSDGQAFSVSQICADIEHDFIAYQISLRILNAAQSMLTDNVS